MAEIVQGVYNLVLPSGQSGQVIPIQVDSSGRLITTTGTPGATSSSAKTEDTVHGSGDTGTFILGVRNDVETVRTDTNADYSPVAVDSIGAVKVAWATANTRLVTAAASTNATLIKSTGGRVFKIYGRNNAAATRYLKFYNNVALPVPGTTALFAVFEIPATSLFALDLDGVVFSAGIGFALTTGGADADASALTAGDITSLNVFYS